MRTFTLLSSLAVLALSSAAVVAQDLPAAAPAPTAAAIQPTNCSPSMRRHDHGAERNAPSAPSVLCRPAAAPAASASAAQTAPKPLHDHSKFHKNQ